MDHLTLSTSLVGLDQLVQDISDQSTRREQNQRDRCLTEASIIPRPESVGTEGLGKNAAALDLSTSRERATTDSQEGHSRIRATAKTIGSPPGPQNISRARKTGKKRPISALDPADIQLELMLLEQENKKRLMMARQEANALPVQAELVGGLFNPIMPLPPDHGLQLALLEQKNKKMLMMAHHGLPDNPPLPPKPTDSPGTTSPQDGHDLPERTDALSGPKEPRRPFTIDELAPTP